MHPRFTPALCEWLDGNGWNIRIEEILNGETKPETAEIHIIIEQLPEEDLKGQIKEMLELSKLRCTNG